MKKLFIILLIVSFFGSCNDNPVPKPNNLLTEEQMVDILYDIAILQATGSSNEIGSKNDRQKIDAYIFEKYKIDSVVYTQNQKYYASNTKQYKKIHQKVVDRIKAKQAVLDEKTEKDKTTKTKLEEIPEK